VPHGRRTARFRAIIVVLMPDGSELIEDGTLEGVISRAPSGAGGFGYDPVMFVPEQGLTVAQLSLDAKNAISHRGLAAAKMRERLRALAG
jgi:XTP/dITP diphosphohydrolase